MPTTRMNNPPIGPRIGAAIVVVPKKVVGMMFWICGLPGSASIAKVKVPSDIVAGMRRLGIAASRNSSAAKG